MSISIHGEHGLCRKKKLLGLAKVDFFLLSISNLISNANAFNKRNEWNASHWNIGLDGIDRIELNDFAQKEIFTILNDFMFCFIYLERDFYFL